MLNCLYSAYQLFGSKKEEAGGDGDCAVEHGGGVVEVVYRMPAGAAETTLLPPYGYGDAIELSPHDTTDALSIVFVTDARLVEGGQSPRQPS